MIGKKRYDKQFLAFIPGVIGEGVAFSALARLLRKLAVGEYWSRYGAWLQTAVAQRKNNAADVFRGLTPTIPSFGYVPATNPHRS
jgi:hypothetical protein